MDVRENIQKAIIDLIAQENGLSAFARKVGATPQNARNWVAGASSPSLDALGRISEAYGVPLSVIMEGRSTKNVPELLPDEEAVVELMRQMNAQGRKMLLSVAESFKKSGSYDA